MDILSYLTELIKTRKEVGITGLGTIYKKKSPGRYDAETHSFLPPSYKLGFTEDVTETQALAEYISKEKNISLDSSSYYIEQFADELQKQLKDTGAADLGELGSFRADEDGLFFTPPAGINFGFDFYGLPSVKEEVVAEEHGELSRIDEHVAEHVEAEISESVEKNAEPAAEHEFIEEPQAYQEQIVTENEQRNDMDDYLPEEKVEQQEILPEEQTQNTAEQPAAEQPSAGHSNSEPDDQPVYDEISEFKPEQNRPKPVFIETPEGQEETDEHTSSDPYWNFDKAHTIGDQPFYESPEQVETLQSGMPVWVKTIIVVLILLALGIVIYFVQPDLFKKADVKPAQNPVPVKQDSIKTDSTVVKGTPDSTAQPAQQIQDTSKTKAAAVEPAAATDTATTWEVIGASVINEKEVRQVVADMKAIGIVP
ncbi:MAG TPA: hypothetical protein VKB19_01870, partial [Pedobacter sp.]|nr:hypothetical protein [Pedobacter sp.]